MLLSSAVQEALVALLCFDSKAAPIAASLVQTSEFDAFYQPIAEAAVRYREKFKAAPGEHTIDLVENLKAKFPKDAEIYDRILASLHSTIEGINVAYVLERASLFGRYQKMRRGIQAAVDLMETDEESSVVEAERALREGLDTTSEFFDPGTLLQDHKRSLRFMDRTVDDEDYVFRTGIEALDRHKLGPTRKRFHLLCGAPGRGKSWWLVNLAKHAMLDGKRVLYITMELDEEEVLQRIFQALFSITSQQQAVNLMRFDRDDNGRFLGFNQRTVEGRPSFQDPNIRQMLTRRIDKQLTRKADLYVKEFPMNSLTVPDMLNYLDGLEASTGFIPDELILDYVDSMKVDTRNYRIDLGALNRTLKGVASKRNIAIASVSQLSKEGAQVGQRIATGEHAAEDYSKKAVADFLFTYNQTMAEKQLGLARIHVDKARARKDNFTVLMSQSYDLGQFCMDEVGYLPSYWDQVDPNAGKHSDSGRGAAKHQRAEAVSDEGDESPRTRPAKQAGLDKEARRTDQQARGSRRSRT